MTMLQTRTRGDNEITDLGPVSITGNVAGVYDLNIAPSSGRPVMNFSLAVERYVDNGDRAGNITEFYRANVFGELAKKAHAELKVGQRASIEGKLQRVKWLKAPDPSRAERFEVMVDEIDFKGAHIAIPTVSPASAKELTPAQAITRKARRA
jgi:single-stranded DNA-binding protein